nr:toprim domain-containing protein [Novosphingobium sp. ERW19]
MGICEGFESAAAFTCLTGIQAFATMGAARFHQIDLPQGLERLILLADNDREGRRAQIRASRTLVRPGLAIETRWPPRGLNDWADALKQ